MKNQFFNSLIFIIIICGCNNNKHHRVVWYYPNGKIQAEYDTLSNGNIDGIRSDYYSTGEIWFIHKIDNGFLNGEAFEYYRNGQVKQQNYFIMNQFYGWTIYYDSLGAMTHKYDYVFRPDKKSLLGASEEQLFNFDRYEEGKVESLNGYYLYTDGKLNLDSSYFCLVVAKNTHIKLGDSVHIDVYINPAFQDVKRTEFAVRIFDTNKNEIVKTFPRHDRSIAMFLDRLSILPTKKGSGYIYGVIREQPEEKKGYIMDYVFKQEYFVE